MNAATEQDVQATHVGNGVYSMTVGASDEALIEGLQSFQRLGQFTCCDWLEIGVTTDIVIIRSSSERRRISGTKIRCNLKKIGDFWILKVVQPDDIAPALAEFLYDHPNEDIEWFRIGNESHHPHVVILRTRVKAEA